MNRFFAFAILLVSAVSSVRADAVTGTVKNAYLDFRPFSAGVTCEGQPAKSAFVYFDIQVGGNVVTVYSNNDSQGKNALSIALTAAASGKTLTVGYTASPTCSSANKMDYIVLNP